MYTLRTKNESALRVRGMYDMCQYFFRMLCMREEEQNLQTAAAAAAAVAGGCTYYCNWHLTVVIGNATA